MINFKNWLEDVAASTPAVNNPNNPSNVAAKNIANNAFKTQPIDKSIQLATAKSPEKITSTALGIAANAMKSPSNQKIANNVTPVQVAQTITKGITGKPMPSTSMPATQIMMGKK